VTLNKPSYASFRAPLHLGKPVLEYGYDVADGCQRATGCFWFAIKEPRLTWISGLWSLDPDQSAFTFKAHEALDPAGDACSR